MKKLLITNLVIFSLMGTCVFLLGRLALDNWDVISLKRDRPELIEAMEKVQAEEEKEIEANTRMAKENTIKKILSPLVVAEEETVSPLGE